MRVLVLNDQPLDAGAGAEVWLRRVLPELVALGDDVHVLTAADLPGRRRGGVLDRPARDAVRRRAAALRPDVVWAHNLVRDLSVGVLPGLPAPRVLTVHDGWLLGLGRPALPPLAAAREQHLVRPAARALARASVTATLTVSEALAGRLRRARFPRVAVLPVPAPPAPVGPPPSSSRDVVFAGRLVPDKGVHVLLEAFAQAAVPGSRLLVAGDGPQRARLEQRAAGQVAFLGWLPTDEVARVVGRARLLAVPSLPALRPEGSSLSAVEAATLGRPVVVSDDPAACEVVRALGAGPVVPAGDVPALASALRRLLRDDAEADRLGAAARAASAAHAPAAVAAAARQVLLRACRPA